MKKVITLFLSALVISAAAGCDGLHEKTEYDDIEVEPFTAIDKVANDYAVYYGFHITNNRPETVTLDAEVNPKDSELKKVIGDSLSTTDGKSAGTPDIESGTDTTIGITVFVPKEKFTKKELEKKAKDFSFSIYNGKTKKIYE